VLNTTAAESPCTALCSRHLLPPAPRTLSTAALQVRMCREAQRVKKLQHASPDVQFCYGMLNQVSRSFAIVIQQLPEELRDAVCVFYLVLRALDSIEDDMAFPVEQKLPLLRSLHEHVGDKCGAPVGAAVAVSRSCLCALCAASATISQRTTPVMSLKEYLPIASENQLDAIAASISTRCRGGCSAFARRDCGEKPAERELLREYPRVAAVFNALPTSQQDAIRDICARMGAGMADFIEKDEVATIADYDLYCHYVAGARAALQQAAKQMWHVRCAGSVAAGCAPDPEPC
jgi:phytoene/squalene synthetase